MKVLRVLEDAVEMSDMPCVGGGLWELAEAHEFDVYFTYMVCNNTLMHIQSFLVKGFKAFTFISNMSCIYQ